MSKNLIKIITILSTLSASLNLTITPAIIKEISQNPVIKIPKINLKQEFYPNDKIKNNVDKGIQVIETSVMPNKNGNLILASHSGNSKISHFKNLDKLAINDNVYIQYQNKIYKYIIKKIYDVEKTGYINIKRNKTKQTLTLITCKKNTNKQTVFIGYLAP